MTNIIKNLFQSSKQFIFDSFKTFNIGFNNFELIILYSIQLFLFYDFSIKLYSLLLFIEYTSLFIPIILAFIIIITIIIFFIFKIFIDNPFKQYIILFFLLSLNIIILLYFFNSIIMQDMYLSKIY